MLLTGQADEQVAVRAFNRGLIDQFMPKQTPDISRRLIDAVEHLLATPHARHAQTWRVTLSPEQNAVLRTPAVERDLAAFVSRRWVEHVVIGDPFGVLALDDAGQAAWLQLEHLSRLDELAELGASAGIDSSDLARVRSGDSLFDGEFQLAIGSDRGGLVKAVSLGHGVLAALSAVPPSLCPGPDQGYACFLREKSERPIDDITPVSPLAAQTTSSAPRPAA